MSSSASVETHGRAETEALLTASRSFRASRSTTRTRSLEEMDLDALIARRPQIALVDELAHTNAPGSRHPKRYLDVEELLVARHRRLHHGQHPAHRKPQRRRRADHACARARDRAGLGVRPRRRHRADRPHARRPDPAAEGGQGLRPQAGRARAGALFLAGQSDGAARTGAAAHRRAGRRAAAHPHAGATPSPGPGRRASAFWSASARIRAPPASCATPSGWPTGCTRHGRRSASRRRRSLQLTDEQRDRLADTLRLAEALGGEARDDSRRRPPHRRRRHPLRARQQRHADHHRQVDALAVVRADARFGRARSGAPLRQYQRPRHRRRRGRGELVRRRRCAPPRGRSRSIRGPISMALLFVAIGARRRPADPAAGSASRTSISCSSPPWSASPCATACGRRCSPASWRRCATISSSCRRSTPSPSPTRPTSRRSSSSC